MHLFKKIILHAFIVIILTIITQIGGIIWLIALLTSKYYKVKKRYIFPIIYLIFNLLIIPPTANFFGREKLPVFSKRLSPRNIIYPLLFRNYTSSKLKLLLISSATNLSSKNIRITYLDANFPFANGFPLLPHLSHNDGKKIDIAFMYLDRNQKATHKKPSTSGYGAYAYSDQNITNNTCKEKGYWQYDFTKYLTFGTNKSLILDKINTKLLIKELISNKATHKILIEPHLKRALGFENNSKVRFQGCQAVRHDDHIHLEIK